MHFNHYTPRQVIIYDFIHTKQKSNEKLENFVKRSQKTWSILKESLSKGHVIIIFFYNIFPKLKFIAMDYMDFSLILSKY